MSDSTTKPPSFVVQRPLIEKPKIEYIPSKHNPAFSAVPSGVNPIGYELDEDDLLMKLKSGDFPIHIKEYDSFWVKDGIGNYYTGWDSKTPAFISAQTGRGKSTIIKRVLIPHVKDLNCVENTKWEILSAKREFNNKIL